MPTSRSAGELLTHNCRRRTPQVATQHRVEQLHRRLVRVIAFDDFKRGQRSAPRARLRLVRAREGEKVFWRIDCYDLAGEFGDLSVGGFLYLNGIATESTRLLSAPAFHVAMVPSRSTLMMASSEDSTMAAKRCAWLCRTASRVAQRPP